MNRLLKIAGVLFVMGAVMLSACGGGGDGENEIAVPEAPGAAAITSGHEQLLLSWTAVSGAAAYEVWFSTTNDSSTASQSEGDVTGTTHTISALENRTLYYIWLKSKNSAGISDFGEVASEMPGYKVIYNAGTGNTYGTLPDDSTVYDADDTVTVSNSGDLAGALIRDGIRQRFVEWNIQSDGNGTSLSGGETFTINGNMTLYAIYTTGTDVLTKVGPAGGWIFYDAGTTQAWGRYLEASPTNLPLGIWGTVGVDVPGAVGYAIGTGKQNTADIIAGDIALDKAADKCAAYSAEYNGVTYDEWFLPSIYELEEMYNILNVNGVGNFNNANYWSSTESSVTYAIEINFDNGSDNGRIKNNNNSVRTRPVRAF